MATLRSETSREQIRDFADEKTNFVDAEREIFTSLPGESRAADVGEGWWCTRKRAEAAQGQRGREASSRVRPPVGGIIEKFLGFENSIFTLPAAPPIIC
ncbi:hypothetical protein GWI33_019981 [Rhynchophorus ferrugineus]|uniref:Uncharacterized protein n=1 Tax=Rhynchophorus ferrugineus TaxID=354439 RepID=A0A834HTA8_RHYFE|nr:hypothetical protein GWI33_019981 [Rhynchophorus ferrugineus]